MDNEKMRKFIVNAVLEVEMKTRDYGGTHCTEEWDGVVDRIMEEILAFQQPPSESELLSDYAKRFSDLEAKLKEAEEKIAEGNKVAYEKIILGYGPNIEAENAILHNNIKGLENQLTLAQAVLAKMTSDCVKSEDEVKRLQTKLADTERALMLASQEPEELTQEAGHYNWLEDKNEELLEEVKRLRYKLKDVQGWLECIVDSCPDIHTRIGAKKIHDEITELLTPTKTVKGE